jgi:hypothetical protein
MSIAIETERKLKDNKIEFILRHDEWVLLKEKQDKSWERKYFPNDDTINSNIDNIIKQFD